VCVCDLFFKRSMIDMYIQLYYLTQREVSLVVSYLPPAY